MADETFLISQGAPLAIDATLEDAVGAAITGYAGTEALTTVVWPGGVGPASFVASATIWTDPAAGLIRIALSGAQTAACVPGRYQLLTRLADGTETVDAYQCNLVITPFAGGVPAAPTSALITRQACEIELVDRASAMLLLAGRSTNADGSNPALTGPLWFACSRLGVAPALIGVVSDADLARVDPANYIPVCDLAELRLIQNCLGSFAQPDQSSLNTKTQFNAMMLRFQARAAALEAQYSAAISIRRAPTIVGQIRFDYPTPGTSSWGLGWGRADH